MKTFIAAIALTFALPAAANAQAPQHGDHHAQHRGNHDQHKGMDHGKEHKDCCEHKAVDGKPMECCKEKDGKRAACCDKHAKGHDGHAGMKH
jgi:uncharacterized protein involved in copper resistance